MKNIARQIRHNLLQSPASARLLLSRLSDEIDAQTHSDIIAAVDAALVEITDKLDALTHHAVFTAGAREAEAAPTDIALLTEGLVRKIDDATPDVEVVFRTNGTQSDRIHVDASLLRIALDNVLMNAADFTQEGKVDVSLEMADSKAVWTITDEGPGLAPEEATLAMRPFYADVQLASRRMGHLGLGLSNALAAAELIGASVALSGRTDGPGAVCVVTLGSGY